jgi:hypothetical protein
LRSSQRVHKVLGLRWYVVASLGVFSVQEYGLTPEGNNFVQNVGSHPPTQLTSIIAETTLILITQSSSNLLMGLFLCFVSLRSPYLTYPLTVGVEVVYFHLITPRHTSQTRDRPIAETSTLQHTHSQDTNIHAPGGIRTHDLRKRSAANLRRRPRGHWYWQFFFV